MKKQKVYVLMVSRVFPATHPKKGQDTNFRAKILCGHSMYWGEDKGEIITIEQLRDRSQESQPMVPKIHTIRLNYDIWARRAEKINRGEAILSLRQWTGSPYNYKSDGSKQEEFMRLEKIDVQKIELRMLTKRGSPQLLQIRLPDVKKHGSIPMQENISVPEPHIEFARTICKNDGLNDYDFKMWFKKYFVGVIIHFTDFKY